MCSAARLRRAREHLSDERAARARILGDLRGAHDADAHLQSRCRAAFACQVAATQASASLEALFAFASAVAGSMAAPPGSTPWRGRRAGAACTRSPTRSRSAGRSSSGATGSTSMSGRFLAFLCFAVLRHVGALSNVLLILYVLGLRRHLRGGRAGACGAAPGALPRLSRACRSAAGGDLLAHSRVSARTDAGAPEPLPPAVDTILGTIADAYPIKQSSELAWVKIALRVLELVDRGGAASGKAGSMQPAMRSPAHYWVQGQYAFFRTRGYRLKRTRRRHRAHAILLLRAGAVRDRADRDRLHVAGADRSTNRVAHGLLIVERPAARHRQHHERVFRTTRARRAGPPVRPHAHAVRARLELLPETIDDATAPLTRRLCRARPGGDDGEGRVGRDLSPAAIQPPK